MVYFQRPVGRDDAEVVMRMKEIVRTRLHYGYRRVHSMLRREGFKDN
jgi:putative transposase